MQGETVTQRNASAPGITLIIHLC